LATKKKTNFDDITKKYGEEYERKEKYVGGKGVNENI